DEAALAVAASILGAETSPLVKALNLKLSLGVSLNNEEWQDASMFSLIVSIVPGAKLAEVEKTAMAELERFAREGPSALDLERIKNGVERGQLTDLQSPAGLARALLRTRQYYGSIDRWGDWCSRLTSLTADDLRTAVGRWLT